MPRTQIINPRGVKGKYYEKHEKRDREIYRRYVVNDEPGNVIAKELGLTRQRVSQIAYRYFRHLKDQGNYEEFSGEGGEKN